MYAIRSYYDAGIERRHEHERVFEVGPDPVVQGLDAHGAFVAERHAGVADQAGRLQEVGNHDGFEHVQLEVAGGAPHVDRHVVAQHLGSHHGKGLALRGIDFAGHDARNNFV